MPFSRCEIHCPVCAALFDWMRGYGRDQRCCCADCYREFDWRRTLATLGREYYPDPQRVPLRVVDLTPPEKTHGEEASP